MQTYPEMIEKLLLFSPKDLDARSLQELIDFNLSEPGSNNNIKERQTMSSMALFLAELEGIGKELGIRIFSPSCSDIWHQILSCTKIKHLL